MAKHTPGPWTLVGPSGDRKCIAVEAHGDGWHRLYCEVGSDDCDYDTAEANARLIAASPDLLEACEVMLEELEEAVDWETSGRAMARAAIARATGA